MNRREFLKLTAQGAAVAAASRVVPAQAAAPKRLTLAAVGDCIVTRKVSHLRDPDFLAAVELLRGADCTWGNCELVLANARDVYPAPKGGDPHTIAPPWGRAGRAFFGSTLWAGATTTSWTLATRGWFPPRPTWTGGGSPTPERGPTWRRAGAPGTGAPPPG